MKGIDDAKAFVQRHVVPHILRPQRVAAGVEGRGGDHGVAGGKAVPLGEPQSGFVDLNGKRVNRQQTAKHFQKRVRIGPGHLHLPARDIGDLVENLHADRIAGGDDRLRSIRFCCIA